ncbi:MAG: hypothetical protein RL094_48 [Candidatus Parcubacteria bacterium]|jgi:DNA polymerase-3 subunit beta
MKAECVREKLAEAVHKAEKITSKNATLPVLKCVLIEATSEGLIVRSTNLDLGIELFVPAKVHEQGSVAIPGSTLNSFLSNLSNEKGVTLEMKEGNMYVSTSRTSTTIKAFPLEDYPSIPKVDTESGFKMPSDAFIRGLKSVWYSSATSSIKPELSSVRVYPDEEHLVFVATDGFRLAEKKVKVKQLPEFNHILIPVKNAVEIIRVFEGINADIAISIEQNQLALSCDGIYLVSRTVEGNFPDYKAIIPKEFTTEVILLKQDLVNTLKLSTIFSDSFNHIKFLVHPISKEIELITKNTEVGENASKLTGAITGDSLDINFNYKYITDSFQAVDADSLSFSFSGGNKPLIVKGVSDKSFLYLVMPMNR